MAALLTYEKATTLPVTQQEALEWHARPGAFQRLSPPWQAIDLVKPNDGIEAGATLIMKLLLGPLGLPWHALHVPTEGYEGFCDIQTRGPFAKWRHDHIFTTDSDGRSILRDRVSYRLPLWPLSHPIAGWAVRKMLHRMFRYRHATTEEDLRRHNMFKDAPRLRVAITGASGLIGSALSAFLTTGGHDVIHLVRRPARDASEAQWSPSAGLIDTAKLDGIDALIHLAGESIAGSRWSKSFKTRVFESRITSTRRLIETMQKLDNPPKHFLCASAIGIYGAERLETCQESTAPGSDFLAHVCKHWEEEASKAETDTTRVSIARFGVVLSPRGGALKKMLLPFQMGVGGALGSGDQWMSWVSLSDAVYALHEMLIRPELRGPFNISSPNPVRNLEFTKTLGNVLGRPTLIPVPKFAIKAALGEMGNDLLLKGVSAIPTKLQDAQFAFTHSDLSSALRHELGLSES